MQYPLIVDTINDAVRDTCRAIGMKKIAKELWPTKTEEAAARYLNDCVNPEREQKLSIEEVLLIARRGRDVGCYLITAFVCSDTGFQAPVAIEPEDEKAALQRAYIASVEDQKRINARMERLAK